MKRANPQEEEVIMDASVDKIEDHQNIASASNFQIHLAREVPQTVVTIQKGIYIFQIVILIIVVIGLALLVIEKYSHDNSVSSK